MDASRVSEGSRQLAVLIELTAVLKAIRQRFRLEKTRFQAAGHEYRINSDPRKALAGTFRTRPASRREGAISVQLTSIGIFPASLSPSVPLCPRFASCSFPYPFYRLCRPFRHPLLLRVVVQESFQHADNVANWVCFVQSHPMAFLDILGKTSFLNQCRYI